MQERKTEVVNLRMTPEIKGLLRRAADHDHRTLSNMLEVLILGYCREHNLLEVDTLSRRLQPMTDTSQSAERTASRSKFTTQSKDAAHQ